MIYLLAIVAGLAGAVGSVLAVWILGAAAWGMTGLPEAGATPVLMVLSIGGGLAGLIAGMIVTLRAKGRVRTRRALATHCAAVLTLIAAGGGAMVSLQASTLSHLGFTARVPAVEFEIRLPEQSAQEQLRRDAQVELRTDRNQALASLANTWRPTGDGGAVLKGHVPIAFQTSERLVVLNLPGQPQRLFKLRLSERPKISDDFGPWHQVDFVAGAGIAGTQRAAPTEGFAIRYRVI